MGIIRNIGVLPMNAKYEVINFFRANLICQNCGKKIKNCVLIKRLDVTPHKEIITGEDCAETLSYAEISNFQAMQDMKKDFSIFKRNLSKINKLIKSNEFVKIKKFEMNGLSALFIYSKNNVIFRSDSFLNRPRVKFYIEYYLINNFSDLFL